MDNNQYIVVSDSELSQQQLQNIQQGNKMEEEIENQVLKEINNNSQQHSRNNLSNEENQNKLQYKNNEVSQINNNMQEIDKENINVQTNFAMSNIQSNQELKQHQYQGQEQQQEPSFLQAQIRQKSEEIIEFKERMNQRIESLISDQGDSYVSKIDYFKQQQQIIDLKNSFAQEREQLARERGDIMTLHDEGKKEQIRKVNEYKGQIQDLEQKYQQEKQQNKQLQDKCNQSEQEIDVLRKSNFDLDRHIKKQQDILEISLNQTDQRFDEGLANHTSLSTQVEQLRYNLQETENKLEQNQKAFDSVQLELKESWEKADRFKEENLKLIVANQNLKGENDGLRAQLQIDPKFMTEYRADQNEVVLKIQKYEDVLRDYLSQMDVQRQATEEKQNQIEQLLGDNNRLINEKDDLYKKLDQKQQTVDDLKTKVNNYENQMSKQEGKQDQQDQFSVQFDEINAQFSEILNQIQNQDNQLHTMDSDKLEAEKQKDFWYNKYNLEEQKNENLKQKLEQLQQTIDQQNEEIEELKSCKVQTRKKGGKKNNNNNNKKQKEKEKEKEQTIINEDNIYEPSNDLQSESVQQQQQQQQKQNSTNNQIKNNLLSKKNRQGIFSKAIMCPNCKILIRTNAKKANHTTCDSCGDYVHKTCIELDDRNNNKAEKFCLICYQNKESQQNKIQEEENDKMQEEQQEN